jgi:3-hydroxy acid dehydrogenase / malonic semialdehyde reductase
MNDRVVWVTGASSGIGAATCRRFAGAGARVVAIARRAERLKALQSEFPDKIVPLVVDVTDHAALSAGLSGLQAGWQNPDVLVNNAGAAFGLETAQEARWEDWSKMVDLNVTSVLYLTHSVLPGMIQRNRGHIINLGSVAGTYPYKGGQVYGATKAFVEQLSLNLRCDVFGTQVRVTSIEPGAVETEFSEVRFRGDKERAAQVYKGFEALTSDDIAEAIFWCASQPARVNVNRLEVMPTMQVPAGFVWHRDDA